MASTFSELLMVSDRLDDFDTRCLLEGYSIAWVPVEYVLYELDSSQVNGKIGDVSG